MEMHIAGRRKKGYIIGRKAVPTKNDPSYDEWEAEDALVKSWLINSMTDKPMAHFVQCGTTKEAYDAVKKSYLDVSNSSPFSASHVIRVSLKEDNFCLFFISTTTNT